MDGRIFMERRNIENAIKDDLKRFVTPIISSDGIYHFIACSTNHFEEVSRYMRPNLNMDFEILTSIDYSVVANDDNIGELIRLMVSSDHRYRDEELLYLLLRTMLVPIWKLDVFLLTHLRKCAETNEQWNYTIGYLAQNKLDGYDYSLTGLPYWLRNEHINLLQNPYPECDVGILHSVELAMLKSNDIQASFRALGNNRMIVLDYGLYIYLAEWCKLILSGYRLRKYCEENDYALTEPIKTGASLVIAIADILANRRPVFLMPPSMMLFDKNDPLVIKEIVMHQIDFILAHEYGHIILNHHSESQANEIDADLFSVRWIHHLKSIVKTLNDKNSEGVPTFSNNIQATNDLDRKTEAIEILFAFFELFYYVCEKRKYNIASFNIHPQISERRAQIRDYHSYTGRPHLIRYTDELSECIRNNIDMLLC